jgi:hypothetical protein
VAERQKARWKERGRDYFEAILYFHLNEKLVSFGA